MSKRGDASQVFVYTITAVVAAMVLIFGYKAIGTLSTGAKTAGMVKFKNTFSDTVDRNSGYGRIAIEEFDVPGKYVKLCLIHNKFTVKDKGADALLADYPEALDIAETSDNAFLADEQKSIDPFKVPNFEVGNSKYRDQEGDLVDLENAVCFDIVGGKAEVKFEGKGDKTLISQL